MKPTVPLVGLTLIALALAAYLWNSKSQLVAENDALKKRVSIAAANPSPTKADENKPEAKDSAVQTTETPAPPVVSEEEAARRKEFGEKMAAQQQKESDARYIAKLNVLKTRLDLTPEQQEMAGVELQKARDIRKAARESFKPGQPPDFAMMQQMMKSESLAAAEIRAKLAPEQQVKYDALRQEERVERAEDQTNRQMSDWQQYLKMSPEQKDAVFQAMSGQALANDPELQPDAADFEEVKKRMEASQTAQREALAGVLDEAQMNTYDEMNKGRAGLFGGFGGPGGGGPPPAR